MIRHRWLPAPMVQDFIGLLPKGGWEENLRNSVKNIPATPWIGYR
jgi:hypothetical protein